MFHIFSVIPDKFVPVGKEIEIVGAPTGGSGQRYLHYDFSQHFAQSHDDIGYKEIVLQPGQYLGIVKGRIGYT